MATVDETLEPDAWSAQQQRWYASLVAHCQDGFDSSHDVPTVLAALSAKPSSECLQMAGDASLDGRVEDCDQQLWSSDLNGRWFKTVDRKVVWLHRELVRMLHGRLPLGGEVASHLCGFCGCIRVQHLRIQSRREDSLDRSYHRAHGRGRLRPRKRPATPASPACVTVERERVRRV